MTKEVLLSISGLQMEADEGEYNDEPIEVVTPANYFFKNGKHYVIYDEVAEGIQGTTKNKIKIQGNVLEIMKSGAVNVHMVFEKGKKNLAYYNTPFGQMMIGIHTTGFVVKEEQESMEVRVEYALDVNHDPLAECKICMNVRSKSEGGHIIDEPIFR